MAAKLETMLTSAMQTAFEELDIFCRAALSCSKGSLETLDSIDSKEVVPKEAAAIVLQCGPAEYGVFVLPLEAAIFLSGSMMLLPIERIQELIELRELDEESILTLNEVANILVGSFSRVIRELTEYGHDIRVKDVVIQADQSLESIHLPERDATRYDFTVNSDRLSGFLCHLYLPGEMARALAPTDPMLVARTAEPKKDERPAPPPKDATPPPPAPSPTAAAPEADPQAGKAKRNVKALHGLLASEEAQAVGEPSIHGTRVLIVDDSWVDRRNVARLLIPHGCVIHDARDTRVARQILRDHPIDVILLDLHLAGESGITFCAQLKAEGMTDRTPVVFLSGASTSVNVVEAIRAGASYFLVKPVNERNLLRVLHGILKQFQPKTPEIVPLDGGLR